MAKTCGNCRFWRKSGYIPPGVLEEAVQQGRCHRYPATVEKDAHDWCGEHVIRKPS